MKIPMVTILGIAGLAVFASTARAQISQPSGASTPSFGTMPNNSGFQQNAPLGSGGSFRPNNSSFGSPLGLQTPSAGTGTNPFEQARVDPQDQGRAGTGTTGTTQTQTRQPSSQSRGGNNLGNNRFGQGGNRFGQGQFGLGQGRGTFSQPPQVMVRLAVTPEPVPQTAVVDAARAVLTPATIPGITGLQVRYNNGVAILEGEVETDREAQLAGAILSLEPGVWQIENRLRIRAAE